MGSKESSEAIYEVDWENQSVVFSRVGQWKNCLKLDYTYSYDEVEQIFLQSIYSPDSKIRRRILRHDPDGDPIHHVGERIQSREFQGRIPGSGVYEWFSDFLVGGESGKLLGNIRNIHRQKTRELEIEYRAKFDQLTGLYNRRTFEDRFGELVKEHHCGCFGILDIDNFKRLNDESGHIQGDQALEAISRIMRESLPVGSLCGRFGGDEFLLFFPSSTEREPVKRMADKLMDQLASIDMGGKPLTISIGLAICPEWGTDFLSLLGHADTALRFSKKAGKNRYTFCSEAIERLIKADDGDSIPKGQRWLQGKAFERHVSKKQVSAAVLISLGILAGVLFLIHIYNKVLGNIIIRDQYGKFATPTLVISFAYGMVFLVFSLGILTVRERSRRILMKVAYVDPVTGGNNLTRFIMQVPASMAESGYKSIILYANVVGFKTYNDRMGRTGADEVLKKIYQEIESNLGRGECIGRLMADHYGILLKAETKQEIIGRIENWNLQMMRIGSREKEPFALKLNYGIYFVDEPGLDVQQMLDRANLARQSMEGARPSKVTYAFYDKELKNRFIFEKELTDHMETALERGEFQMFLQTKYGVGENEIVGAEALVRWMHPTRGMIMPGDFIPLFEKNGFIGRLDLYMFQEACKWIQQVIDRGWEPIPVSVNLSTAHFYNPNFLKEFKEVWEEYGFPPSLLELEFTESMMYEKLDGFRDIIEQIHQIGFGCSMDDFGSGYSSLNELSCLPFNVIKLDRRFFMESDRNEQKRTTVRYAIQLIKALDMKVVAEGVESMEQVEWLREYGCDIIQGYVFARPTEAGTLLEELTILNDGGTG